MTRLASPAERNRIVAWLNVQQAYRVIDAAPEQRLQAAVSLSWAEYEVLFRLQVAGERPLQMRELADQLLASPTGVTRMADRLDRDGLITRETPPDNRRVVTVRLTTRGRSVLGRAERIFLDVLAAQNFPKSARGQWGMDGRAVRSRSYRQHRTHQRALIALIASFSVSSRARIHIMPSAPGFSLLTQSRKESPNVATNHKHRPCHVTRVFSRGAHSRREPFS